MNARASWAVVMPRVTNILAKTDEIDNSCWIAATMPVSGVVKRHLFLDSIMLFTSSPVHYTAKRHCQKVFGNVFSASKLAKRCRSKIYFIAKKYLAMSFLLRS
jgi:hypothetical protein